MKQVFIAGNWKSNKTAVEATDWLREFPKTEFENKTIVLFVPFTLLPPMRHTEISLGAQDVSPFDNGAYTGEVSAKQIKEFADWVLIGHSERRKYFGETEEILFKKVEQAKKAGLKIIYCVGDEKTAIPKGVEVVAYEPVWAIGTGKTDSPENANSVITKIKETSLVSIVIYGGSVTPDNVNTFTSQPAIDGVLPGGASLDPTQFAAIITNA